MALAGGKMECALSVGSFYTVKSIHLVIQSIYYYIVMTLYNLTVTAASPQ